MKMWSYKSITEKAESEITRLMKLSDKTKVDYNKKVYLDWAYGVFLGWNNLTSGWQKPEDRERLEALI